jgi:hypothetical protein
MVSEAPPDDGVERKPFPESLVLHVPLVRSCAVLLPTVDGMLQNCCRSGWAGVQSRTGFVGALVLLADGSRR